MKQPLENHINQVGSLKVLSKDISINKDQNKSVLPSSSRLPKKPAHVDSGESDEPDKPLCEIVMMRKSILNSKNKKKKKKEKKRKRVPVENLLSNSFDKIVFGDTQSPDDSEKDDRKAPALHDSDNLSENNDVPAPIQNSTIRFVEVFLNMDLEAYELGRSVRYHCANTYDNTILTRAEKLVDLLCQTDNAVADLESLKHFLAEHPKFDTKIISVTFDKLLRHFLTSPEYQSQKLDTKNARTTEMIHHFLKHPLLPNAQNIIHSLLQILQQHHAEDLKGLFILYDCIKLGFCVDVNQKLYIEYMLKYFYSALALPNLTIEFLTYYRKIIDNEIKNNTFSDPKLLHLLIGIEIRQNTFDRLKTLFEQSKLNWLDWYPIILNYFNDNENGAASILGQLIALGNKQKNINQAVTKLVYRLRRYPNTDPECQLLDHALTTADKTFQNYTDTNYENYITRQETAQHDYFGIDLSDDSDSESENNYQKVPREVKHTATYRAKELFLKMQPADTKKTLQKILSGSDNYKYDGKILDFNRKLANTHTSNDQIEKDLKKINYFKDKLEFKKELNNMQTQFVVAQYRGIHYGATTWNQTDRQKHRKRNETDKPLYAHAVHDLSGVPFTKRISKSKKLLLHTNAMLVKQRLLALRAKGSYIRKYTPKGKSRPNIYQYDNRALFLQDLYSKSYDDCMYMLAEQFIRNNNRANLFFTKPETINNNPNFKLQSAKNPFISTGAIPLHALKYAYGIKPYKGHENNRLRPRWNKNGQAERPYSGKVYLSLHPIEDYTGEDGAYHLVSLDNLGKVQISELILPEQEVTFPGFIEKDRVVYTHVAKYPAFKGPYKELYLIKYGMDKAMYELYQKIFEKFPPHHEQRKKAKVVLGEYLCYFYELYLYEQAQQIATEQGKVLVFQNEYGDFSLTPLNFTTNKGSKDRIRRREENRTEGRNNLSKKNANMFESQDNIALDF